MHISRFSPAGNQDREMAGFLERMPNGCPKCWQEFSNPCYLLNFQTLAQTEARIGRGGGEGGNRSRLPRIIAHLVPTLPVSELTPEAYLQSAICCVLSTRALVKSAPSMLAPVRSLLQV